MVLQTRLQDVWQWVIEVFLRIAYFPSKYTISYYQSKPVATTQYYVELMDNSEGFSLYCRCGFSVFIYNQW